MSNEEKYKTALEEILERAPSNISGIAKEALKAEFEPVVGKLYMFTKGVRSYYDVFVADVKYDDSTSYFYEGNHSYYHSCRELTDDEWLALGSTVVEVDKTIPLPPQLTITEDDADRLRNLAVNYFNHKEILLLNRLLDGAKIENSFPIDYSLAKECMDAAEELYDKPSTARRRNAVITLGQKIKEARANGDM